MTDTPTCDVRRGRFSKRLVPANHTHTGWCNTSPSTGRLTFCQSADPSPPRGLGQLAVDLLVRVYVEGPLDEGERHLEGLDAELRAVLRDELQPLDAHEAAVAGGVLLQVLHGTDSREVNNISMKPL